MKPILKVQNIAKQYQIGRKKERYKSLRDSFVSTIRKSFKKPDTFWALEDINFNVYPGDTVGIIGKNGAGKSTLLKIISKITYPTKGKITARGRVASLLEVGTGFHPELTGRENVFLNGSILGMRRHEIKNKFDEIIDFSGVEKFIDTPLKHFSSGMQLRLAFGVAAFLEPEILVIDEVLAVGDAEFQKKCLGKMEEVSRKEGRTVLFVSHNLGAVKNLCSKGIHLSNGRLEYLGSIKKAISSYTELIRIHQTPWATLRNFPRANPNYGTTFRFTKILINSISKSSNLKFGEPISLNISGLSSIQFNSISIGIRIETLDQNRLLGIRSSDSHVYFQANGELSVKASFLTLKLIPNSYTITITAISNGNILDQVTNALTFSVAEETINESTVPYSGSWGFVQLPVQWTN